MGESSGHLLLLVGSPKPVERSGSARIASQMCKGLEDREWTTETLHLHSAVRTERGIEELLAAVDRADVIALAAPLYVDSLPAPTLRALELIAAHRRAQDHERATRFVSILVCGFAEPIQNETCQCLLERFAERARLEFIGSISLGGGGFGKRRIAHAFELLVEAIDEEILLSNYVRDLTAKPSMPRWLYILGGNAMWRKVAKANGVADQLKAKPYQRAKS